MQEFTLFSIAILAWVKSLDLLAKHYWTKIEYVHSQKVYKERNEQLAEAKRDAARYVEDLKSHMTQGRTDEPTDPNLTIN